MFGARAGKSRGKPQNIKVYSSSGGSGVMAEDVWGKHWKATKGNEVEFHQGAERKGGERIAVKLEQRAEGRDQGIEERNGDARVRISRIITTGHSFAQGVKSPVKSAAKK